MGVLKKRTVVSDWVGNITLEKVLSSICFMAGIAFMIAALLGIWRHFVTMGICFAVGIMISDEETSEIKSKKN